MMQILSIRAKYLLIPWLLLVSLFTGCHCFADDAALEGEGGAVQLMRGHPTIRMVSEVVKIKLPQGHVDAAFVFSNQGPATTVEIGFPENAIDYDEDPKHAPFTTMKRFRSWVDGRPVTTRRIEEKEIGADRGDGVTVWWTKRVHFAAGQTRRIRDEYTGGTMYVDPDGILGFYYTLETGASWHGTIGDAKILCDIRDMKNMGPIYFQPTTGRRRGNLVVWHMRNIKPQEDIVLAWMNAFAAVEVDGEPVMPLFNDWSDSGHRVWKSSEGLEPFMYGWPGDVWGGVIARRMGDEVKLTAKTACQWLGLHETVINKGRLVLERGPRRVKVTRGFSQLVTNSTVSIRMPHPAGFASESFTYDGNSAPEKDGYTILYLRPLVRALGGSSRWDRVNNRLLITLPHQKG